MREILYRGKLKHDINPKKPACSWVYGGYYFWKNGACIHEANACIGLFVDPETVGQYTGLKDKSGRRIFEGDIVLRAFNENSGLKNCVKSLIKFERGCFLIARIELPPFRMDGYSFYDDYQRLTEYEGHFEIIGNVHDNPELLKDAP